ncbi:AAA family ATPase [Paenibacillus macquariensis]|uniref:AAA family ATPase n=1 Tax=Paenibacillus macquariensis TaxID=948756 RepID=UPI001483532B|nr:AAA family ATPase [Paenibacillus macquariensis]
MHPKLVYLYIGTVHRNFENQGFVFTNDFRINYNNEEHLIIEQNYNPYENLWGPTIQDINLIVGKNGAGKTTLLDILGSIKQERNELFKVKQIQDMQWFAVYHIENDKFVIEGYDPKLIKNIETTSEGDSYDYSFYVKYDYLNQVIHNLNYTQLTEVNLTTDKTDRGKTSLNRKMVSLYCTSNRNKNWTQNTRIGRGTDYGVSFNKIYLQNPKYSNIYNFVVKQYLSWETHSNMDEASCVINLEEVNIEDAWTKEDKVAKIKLNLYKNPALILGFDKKFTLHLYGRMLPSTNKNNERSWTNKQRYIISYLEYMIIGLWTNLITETDKKNIGENIDGIEFIKDGFSNRVSYLIEVIKIVFNVICTNEKYFSDEPYNYDISVIQELVSNLKEIDISYFTSYTTISLNLNTEFNEATHKLLQIIDSYSPSFFGFKSESINVSFSNLSTGQMEFINGFSNLYTAIDIAMNNPQISSILVLLDEPDVSFHPEWSRLYIYNLVKFFENINLDREVKYQLIITTHSPFIVSDVPKEFINCIYIDEKNPNKRVIKKAEFGLMSNFYDIIKSDFFINSPIGEHAQTVFKKLITSIEELDLGESDNEERREFIRKEIKKKEGIITAIGEKIIRDKLMELLNEKKATLFFQNDVDTRINELEKEINLLKRMKEENQ